MTSCHNDILKSLLNFLFPALFVLSAVSPATPIGPGEGSYGTKAEKALVCFESQHLQASELWGLKSLKQDGLKDVSKFNTL